MDFFALLAAILVLVLVAGPIVLLRALTLYQRSKSCSSTSASCSDAGEKKELGCVLLEHPFVLVHAHADDEVMFFLPTLLRLRQQMDPATYARSLVVCMTSNPPQRAHEYVASATRVLGLAPSQVRVVHCCPDARSPAPCAFCDAAAPGAVTVLPRGTLCDGMENRFDTGTVVGVLESVLGHGFCWSQHVFLTFDEGGVSGHPNHIDVGRGVLRACREHGAAAVYTLDSVPLVVKYVPALAALRFAWLRWVQQRPGTVTTCTASASGALLHALVCVYRSQLVWYRCCFAVLSSYAYFNTLTARPLTND